MTIFALGLSYHKGPKSENIRITSKGIHAKTQRLCIHPVIFTAEKVRVSNRQHSRITNTRTSRTEFGQQMRSGDLPAYLSLNCLLNGIVSCSQCYFVQIQPISQKFYSCVTDGPTDEPTDGPTDTSFYTDARTHLKIQTSITSLF